ncbi:zinc finger protein 62-like [Papilio machaon]|uniref:zinc finger protein 62-like n=1 Tax=Papilio machaon TaxID=76193 RepID=UPI001E662BE2|nr:zinc finger protein 62-like [Papilio machaon]
MEEDVTGLISLRRKNNHNNNLRELKIVLDRNFVNSYLKRKNNNISNNKLQNNDSINKEMQETNTKESKMRKKMKFSDNDTYHNNKSDLETSQQSNVYEENFSAYYCDVCGDTFQTTRGLMHHKRFHIKSKGIVFTCALCGDTFENNLELINHKFVHDSEDHCFKCKQCKVAYTNHHDYMQHNAKHVDTDTGLYKCVSKNSNACIAAKGFPNMVEDVII